MRKPDEQEKVVCPDSSRKAPHTPEKVYDRPSPDGKLRGILAKHKHADWLQECPWSGHPVEVIRESKKD